MPLRTSDPVLPALSMQPVLTTWFAPSKVIVLEGGGVAIPEPVSVQLQFAVTSVLFHPASLGAGVSPVNVMVGSVASRLIVTDRVLVPAALVTEHVIVVPPASVSAEMV